MAMKPYPFLNWAWPTEPLWKQFDSAVTKQIRAHRTNISHYRMLAYNFLTRVWNNERFARTDPVDAQAYCIDITGILDSGIGVPQWCGT